MTIQEAMKATHAYACLECGKCTANCPMARVTDYYSPRSVVRTALLANGDPALQEMAIWECLTCGQCGERCPSDIHYSDFIRMLRTIDTTLIADRRSCSETMCSHGGVLYSWMRLSAKFPRQTPSETDRAVPQSRLNWVPPDAEIAEEGEYLYFVGCLPYFDAFFTHLGVRTLDSARSALRILNRLGINPVLLRDERCCGHDLLWTGDVEGFKELALRNAEMIRQSGVKRIVTTCAECVRTLRLDYAPYLSGVKIEILHLVELLANTSMADRLEPGRVDLTGTYHDPCRLGRHLGVYDAPREVLRHLPGFRLAEMERYGKNALCCGTSAWMHCDRFSRQIQHDRLRMAKATGADLLITACPKCAIHFTCAMRGDTENNIEIKDFTTLIGEAL